MTDEGLKLRLSIPHFYPVINARKCAIFILDMANSDHSIPTDRIYNLQEQYSQIPQNYCFV